MRVQCLPPISYSCQSSPSLCLPTFRACTPTNHGMPLLECLTWALCRHHWAMPFSDSTCPSSFDHRIMRPTHQLCPGKYRRAKHLSRCSRPFFKDVSTDNTVPESNSHSSSHESRYVRWTTSIRHSERSRPQASEQMPYDER